MGAPGEAFFCSKGHLFHWIEEHLYWDDTLFRHSKEIEEKGCPCGDKQVLKISHYGDINDCICLQSEVEEKGITPTDKIDEFLVPIIDAIDKKGKPVSGIFHKIHLTRYYIPEDVKGGGR